MKKEVKSVNTEQKTAVPTSRVLQIAEQFFCLILAKNIEGAPQLFDEIAPVLSNHPLYEPLKNTYNAGRDIEALRASVSLDTQVMIDNLLMQAELTFLSLSDKEAQKEASNLATQVVHIWKKEQRTTLQQQIEVAEKVGNIEQVNTLLKQYQQLG